MECQSVVTRGAAPAGGEAADMSALLPKPVGRGFLVTEDQREVGRLSPWDDVAFLAQPLSGPLQTGVGLLPPPVPAAPPAPLAVRFPAARSRRQATGLT